MANTIIRGSGTDAIINKKRKNTSNNIVDNNVGANALSNPAMLAKNQIKPTGYTGDITAGAESYKQNKANTIQYIRDSNTGKVTGVDLSNLGGPIKVDIPMSQISALVNKFTGERMISPNVAFADQKPVIPLTREEQVIADFQQQQSDAALIESLNPPPTLMSPEQIEQDTNPTGQELMNPLSQSIAEKNQLRELTRGIYLNKLSVPLLRLINSKSAGAGSTIFSGTENSQDVNIIKDYFNGYSNKDNFSLVNQHIGDAKASADLALQIASEPGRENEALELYRISIKRLRIADSQLKQLNDNKGYDADVTLARDDLETYFRDLPTKDRTLAYKLQKAGVQ